VIEREELVLVDRFEDLRAGDLVVVKDCPWCGARRHSDMLSRLSLPVRGEVARDVDWSPSSPPRMWSAVRPVCKEVARRFGDKCSHWILTEITVDERRVFKVVIPPSVETEEAETERPLERVRVR
jgi:hypothetical protein